MLGKFILWLSAIAFGIYGIACLLSPTLPAASAGLEWVTGDGYAEIGASLAEIPGALGSANPYREWVAEYSGEPFQQAAFEARASLDRLARERLTEARWPELCDICRQATRLEAEFWDMGTTLSQ